MDKQTEEPKKEQAISPSMTLSAIIRQYPDSVDVLVKYGFLLETLEEARKRRGMQDEHVDKLLGELGELAQAIRITNDARAKILEIMKDEKKDSHGLRIRATPAGFSGLAYEFSFEKEAKKGDTTIKSGVLRMFLDKTSLEVMRGSTIGYVESPAGGGFKIDNPNAPAQSGSGCSSCAGCG